MQTKSELSSPKSAKSSENTINISDIRNYALNMLQDLIAGKRENTDDIHDFCKLADTIIETLKTEIVYLKTIDNEHRIKFIDDACNK